MEITGTTAIVMYCVYGLSALWLLAALRQAVRAFRVRKEERYDFSEYQTGVKMLYLQGPFMVLGMAASLAVNVIWPYVLVYFATGLVWVISFPIRYHFRHWLLGDKFETAGGSLYKEFGLYLVLDFLFWPLAIPAFFTMKAGVGIK
jgi:hypothetical protein